jgi:hypothetical protein
LYVNNKYELEKLDKMTLNICQGLRTPDFLPVVLEEIFSPNLAQAVTIWQNFGFADAVSHLADFAELWNQN